MSIGESRNDVFDVAVVGYGPTGLALAYWLGRAGHKTVVLERWSELYTLPRAGHVDGEVMRLFQRMGIAEVIAPESNVQKRAVIRDSDGNQLQEIMSEDSDQGWEAHYSLYQPQLERLLDAKVRDTGCVTVLQGWQAESIDKGNDGVVRIRAAAGVGDNGTWKPTGPEKTVEARWVIGGDGANSVVRKSLRSPVQDLGYQARALVIFAERLDPTIGANMPDSEVGMVLPRPYVAFRASGKRFARWEFNVNPEETSAEMSTPEKAWELIKPWGFTPETARLVRHSVFEFRTLVVENWRDGQLLVAGDAAHVMPPFQGQGMCSGQRDAAALSWRLDLVLRGISDIRLLDSYTEERKPHVLELTRNSSERGQMFWLTDPVEARKRDARMREGLVSENIKRKSGSVPPLTSGFLMKKAGALVPPAGRLSAQFKVRKSGRKALLDEHIGASWLLLAANRTMVKELGELERNLLTVLNVRTLVLGRSDEADEIEDVDGQYVKWLSDLGCSLVLVRPDLYIFGGSQDAAGTRQLFESLNEQLHLKAAKA